MARLIRFGFVISLPQHAFLTMDESVTANNEGRGVGSGLLAIIRFMLGGAGAGRIHQCVYVSIIEMTIIVSLPTLPSICFEPFQPSQG